ncbi:hypothetical protein B0H14DRAFT_2654983 [Mycena olivaceomarginata]|nr:hypothetical protein B0H14DRAFT_2654983 [Mycena olivaceomarginata]
MGMNGVQKAPPESDEWEGTAAGMMDDGAEFVGETSASWRSLGFARNATFALVFVFSIMAFTRNSGTNLFPMMLGLFLEIGGTSSRILNTLSNAGACVSITTIERLKEVLSKDAVAYAVELMQGTGIKQWENRDAILKAAREIIASDRPLPPKKSDGRPLGVFDVGEGSKMGIVKILKALQEISGLSETEWASKARIVVGDWLTASNIRGARRGRTNDVNSMERLEYVDEESALWHFALNATHMIMRLHSGDSLLDPGSLAKHKGLLNRTWDAEKPNYADAKALIRHSLVSRILYQVMLQNDIKRWADLAKWKPSLEELRDFAHEFVDTFTLAKQAENAKELKDDYYWHSCHFIRDAIIFCVYEDGVSLADAGVVLCVLK